MKDEIAKAPVTSDDGRSTHATAAGDLDGLYRLRIAAFWTSLKKEHFSFWMICGYLFVEYVRPQSIIPAVDFLPWAAMFLVLAIAGWAIDPQRTWVRDPANLLMTVFLIVILIASTLAEYPQYSWPHLYDYFSWYVIYFAIINTVTTRKRFFIFLVIFLLASFKLSFFGARTWALRGFSYTSWGIMGPPGFFQNSGELAVQMLMFSPIAYELALFLKPWVSRTKYWLLLSFPITGAMTVGGAGSRGSQVALIYQAYRSLLKGKLSFKTIALIVALIGITQAVLPDQMKERFSSAGDDRSSQQRLLYWRHGLEMIKEHPVLGVGYFNFAPYYAEHYPQDLLYEGAQLPHNILVQVGTDAGIVGLLVFLALLYRNARAAKSIQTLCTTAENQPDFAACVAKGLLIALWGFIIAGQFVTITYYPFLWINLALTVALLNIVKKERGTIPLSNKAVASAKQSRLRS